jgi:hypothetical protein
MRRFWHWLKSLFASGGVPVDVTNPNEGPE